MADGVVADFKAVFVELGDFLPGHVVFFVVGEVKSFGDEESGVELVFE